MGGTALLCWWWVALYDVIGQICVSRMIEEELWARSVPLLRSCGLAMLRVGSGRCLLQAR